MSDRLRIIVLGYFVREPLGGMVASNLQYLLGLRRLGHDVYFMEESGDYVSCYDPRDDRMVRDPRFGMAFAERELGRIGYGERWAYRDAHSARWLGPCGGRVRQICRDADLVLNLCGVNRLIGPLQDVPIRVFVDEDPGFTQIKHLTRRAARRAAEQHNAFFTFGENIGEADCRIPDDGLPWRPTRPPVALEAWPVQPPAPQGRVTTVRKWTSYHEQQYGDLRLGMKRESFKPYLDLPSRVAATMELTAACLTPEARRRLRRHGWSLRNPFEVSESPATFQRYIESSRGEFSVAKHGYVVTRSGWFSERSALYLASGRPIVVQDTGLSRRLPTGAGVWAFNHRDDAVGAIEAILSDEPKQCRAAREFAEAYLDSDKVLSKLLQEACDVRAHAVNRLEADDACETVVPDTNASARAHT